MSEHVGDLIKKAKTAAGMIQADLAKAVEGFTTSDGGKAEHGKEEGFPDPLKVVAKGIGAASKSLAAGAAATGDTPSVPKEIALNADGEAGPASLTVDEKALLAFYKAANPDIQKAAMHILKGEKQMMPGVTSMFEGLIKSFGENGENPFARMMFGGGENGGNPFSGMLGGMMGMMGSLLAKKGDGEKQDVPTVDSLVVFTYLYSVSIYILLLSFYFWQIRTDIKPEPPVSEQSEQKNVKGDANDGDHA